MKRPDAAALWRAAGPLVGLVFVWVLFRALAGTDFGTWENQRLMLLQTAVVGTAAVGATLIIIGAGIDLSVGSTIALTTMVVALLLREGHGPALAAAGGVGTAALVGVAIGTLVIGHVVLFAVLVAVGALVWSLAGPAAALGVVLVLAALAQRTHVARALPRLELSPFIVTLGMWGALRGLAKGLGDNQPIYPDDLGWLAELMIPARSGLFSVLAPGVWILIALALAFGALLRFSVFGRHLFAVGSSEETARLCGVRVERVKLVTYGLAIACAGVAGLLQLSYLSMGDPTTALGYELKVIAAVVIGGASLSGGEGSIQGTLIGALIMVVVDNGCTKLGLDNWVQEVVTGGIILVAVALDRLRHRGS